MADLFLPAGSAVDGHDPLSITPEQAEWEHTALRVLRLGASEVRELVTGAFEMAILPLSGGYTVELDGRRFDLQGRENVFARVTDFAYAPIDAEVRITAVGGGGEVALPMARAAHRREAAYGPAEEVAVEIRGAGPATRQVTNFLGPDVGLADKLLAVEVITPDGNWSSYPPHKHDEFTEHEVALEEIYYFRIEGDNGFGLHRTYTTDEVIDATVTVRDGDAFLIPRGYHGPCVAPPGYTMYYLNAMAGPGERMWLFCDDPAHGWVRETWTGQDADARLPLTTAAGRRRP